MGGGGERVLVIDEDSQHAAALDDAPFDQGVGDRGGVSAASCGTEAILQVRKVSFCVRPHSFQNQCGDALVGVVQ